jgi:import receptor subunit TOM20
MFEVAAALAFFRALRVYPAPVELIMIYQNTVPPNIFKIVMDLTNQDVSPLDKPVGGGVGRGASDEDIDTDIEENGKRRTGPPSETSSHEWDKLTDPGPP